jgi:endonuclease/exonuclease/phosphatase (EEP) superfamily protein YafD
VSQVLLLAAAIARRLGPLLVAISTAAMTAAVVVVPRIGQEAVEPAVPITIAFANVYDQNHDPQAAAEDLLDTGADVVVAAEATEEFRDAIEEVDTEHRYQFDDGQLLVHAHWPIEFLEAPPVVPEGRAILVRLLQPQVSPISLLVLHAPNPSSATTFAQQTRQVEKIDAAAEDLQAEGPVIIVGDLNLSDRTSGYRELATTFRDVMRAGSWAHNTYPGGIWRLALLRIDHIFVGRDWCATAPDVFNVTGSDHRGIEAVIGPCP